MKAPLAPAAATGMTGSARHLPYTQHHIEQDDIAAVVKVLSGDLIAQGAGVDAFERALAKVVGAVDGVACSSGTAGLHLALTALGVGEGDVCIAPAVTFVATATAARLCGAEVVFADVDPHTGLMTAETLRAAASRAGRPVKVALPVHLGGRLCDMPAIASVADEMGFSIVEDCCHALGSATQANGRAGSCLYAAASVFSFHPAKTIACGEGGAVTTNDVQLADKMRRLRNHGCTREVRLFVDPALSCDADGERNPWSYEHQELGFNYRMTDIEAALGSSQLGKLQRFSQIRRQLADLYDQELASAYPHIRPVTGQDGSDLTLHLYTVCVNWAGLGVSRANFMNRLLESHIGTQVHYIPVYRQPYFAKRYGDMRLSGAEAYYESALSLPLFSSMEANDVQRVTQAIKALI
jgi:UDP-4-amino-4,6-dideoxy-N-acetyl-beta-L-altrosamine transaminase